MFSSRLLSHFVYFPPPQKINQTSPCKWITKLLLAKCGRSFWSIFPSLFSSSYVHHHHHQTMCLPSLMDVSSCMIQISLLTFDSIAALTLPRSRSRPSWSKMAYWGRVNTSGGNHRGWYAMIPRKRRISALVPLAPLAPYVSIRMAPTMLFVSTGLFLFCVVDNVFHQVLIFIFLNEYRDLHGPTCSYPRVSSTICLVQQRKRYRTTQTSSLSKYQWAVYYTIIAVWSCLDRASLARCVRWMTCWKSRDRVAKSGKRQWRTRSREPCGISMCRLPS